MSRDEKRENLDWWSSEGQDKLLPRLCSLSLESHLWIGSLHCLWGNVVKDTTVKPLPIQQGKQLDGFFFYGCLFLF